MKQYLLLLLVLTFTAQADLNQGLQAYHRGDYSVAFEVFNHSEEAEAKHYLASLYYQGKGIPQDTNKAIELFAQAATAGYLPAINNLGLLYLSGEGVSKDYSKAREYFTKAAAQNDYRAMHYLGMMNQKGLGQKRDLKAAATLYKQAAEGGYAQAQYDYGMLLAQGQGIKLDYVTAYAWLNLAEKNGYRAATDSKNRLFSLLKPEQKAQATELANSFLANNS